MTISPLMPLTPICAKKAGTLNTMTNTFLLSADDQKLTLQQMLFAQSK